MKHRNNSGKVAIMNNLNAVATGLQKMQESAVDGMGVDMTGTLQPLCWEIQQVDLFPFAGRLPLMVHFDGGDGRDAPDPFPAHRLI
jgi:hypothetical protein